MTDKIKALFQKKKTNAKFSNAGKGYKLTDNTSTASSASREPREPIKRAEPTQEAKIAGQAALARLEAKKATPAKFNTSYAAIQARVKRELERERKLCGELEKVELKGTAEEQKKQTTDPSILAVVDVYFRCPYMSDEILPRAEWKKRIKEFLYEQLKEEEAGLTSCLIIQNCNAGREKIQNCVETLGKYVDNILNNPDVEKYRKIRMSNRIFQEKVLPIEGALEFLKAAGFEKKRLMNNDEEEDFLVWSPDNCNLEDFAMLAEALRSAEQIPLELDRNLQVLLPSEATARSVLPSSFFSVTLEELKNEQQQRIEAVEKSQMLRTKAMREKDEQRDLRKYKFALIRIKFPDNIFLQGTFSVHEKFRSVVEFVSENLVENMPFVLLSLGQKLTEESFDSTLLELKLMPASVLLFTWDMDQCKDRRLPTQYLKEEVLCYVQDM